MDDLELQRRLADHGLYTGALDGVLGPRSMTAVDAFLNYGNVRVPASWKPARRVLAAKQLVCRFDGIDAGSIDGLDGPQTRYGFERYAESRQNAANLRPIPDRDSDPARPAPRGIAPIWPRQADVPQFYGDVGGDQVRLKLPYPMKLAWDTGKLVTGFSIHRKAHDSALRCFTRIAETYDAAARADCGLDLFGGCLNVRPMRGGSRWSMHAWGIAIDFDPARNALRATKATARLARPDCEPFWKIWEDEGWVSLGRAKNFDWMHVQAARL